MYQRYISESGEENMTCIFYPKRADRHTNRAYQFSLTSNSILKPDFMI